MVYDPAWDMPRVNWQQQGSFEIPEIPPAYEPDAEPLVCLPPINQYWLPYVMGALDQLRNPSSWLVADDDAMYNTLARVTKLREMIGRRVTCVELAMRVDGCNLQFSIDGGDTWTTVTDWSAFLAECIPPQTLLNFTDGCELQESFDGGSSWSAVPGWDTNFGPCVQAHVPIVGLPPNPGDQTGDQLSCSIASYLANEVILNAMQAGVTAIQDNLTLLAFGANVLTLIPEFILVAAGYDAVSIIYTAISEGTLSDYQAAITDDVLWESISCCIYNAIGSDGYVTPGNFGAITSCIAAIPYGHSDVVDAISSYLSSLGATGLAQLSQRAGLVAGAACSGCVGDSWCMKWGPGYSDLCDGIWVVQRDDPTEEGTCSDNAWYSVFGFAGINRIVLECTLPSPRTVELLGTSYTNFNDQYLGFQFWDHYGGTLLASVSGLTLWTGSVDNVGYIVISTGRNDEGYQLNVIQLAGPHGGSPWGASTC